MSLDFLRFLLLILPLQLLMSAGHVFGFVGGLSGGIPVHALGYADRDGCVQYSIPVSDIYISDNIKIPVRLIFSTNPVRRSFVFDAYWSISIFDSFVYKVNSKKILWMTPSLSVENFKFDNSKNLWLTGYQNFTFIESRGGDILIESVADGGALRYRYRDGVLRAFEFENEEGVYEFKVVRGGGRTALIDGRGKVIFSVQNTRRQGQSLDVHVLSDSGDVDLSLNLIDCEFLNGSGRRSRIILAKEIDLDYGLYSFDYDLSGDIASLVVDADGERVQRISWVKSNGLILGDIDSSYDVSGDHGGRKIRRLFSSGLVMERSVYGGVIMDRINDRFVERSYIIGSPRFFGFIGSVKYGSNNGGKVEIRNVYNKDGKLIKTITVER